jgi:hypothetical protein
MDMPYTNQTLLEYGLKYRYFKSHYQSVSRGTVPHET